MKLAKKLGLRNLKRNPIFEIELNLWELSVIATL